MAFYHPCAIRLAVYHPGDMCMCHCVPQHRSSGLGRPGNSAQTVVNPDSLAPVLRPDQRTGRARPEYRSSGVGRPGKSAQTVMNPDSLAPVLRLDHPEFPARPGLSLAPHQIQIQIQISVSVPHQRALRTRATRPSRLETCERVLPVDIGLTDMAARSR